MGYDQMIMNEETEKYMRSKSWPI